MDLIHLFIEGGFIMWPLLIFSVIVWIVFAEKVWFLKRFTKKSNEVKEALSELMTNNKKEEAKKYIKELPTVLRGPYEAVLERKMYEEESVDNYNQRVGRRVKETQTILKRYLWMLGTVASSAPFVGLFGTVVGIIKSFDSIAEAGKSGFAVVAAGLSEALIATAAGIIVAVIAVLFFNYFQTRLSLINEKFQHDLEDFNDIVNMRE